MLSSVPSSFPDSPPSPAIVARTLYTSVPAYSHVLIVGATGKQGSAVVRALFARFSLCQTLLRSVRPRATPQAQRRRSLRTRVLKSLDEALVGVRSAFLVTTRPAKSQSPEDVQGLAFIAAAKRADLAFLVFAPAPTRRQRSAFRISGRGLEWAVVAPVMVKDNLPTQNGWMLSLALGFFHAVFGPKNSSSSRLTMQAT
ncbi:hypothetical protein OF846_004395 [Rhodotorula toruloides]|nr:hypothetical protein OF846_004395 [Rhodotorula toruloides]